MCFRLRNFGFIRMNFPYSLNAMSIIPKGWLGEKQTQFLLWLGLDKNIYRRCHDVIIPAKSGTTQIDHILVSVYGIFVVETKNMNGWIFGDEKATFQTRKGRPETSIATRVSVSSMARSIEA